jgi:outer membrane receptor protein involved in Fe transport
VLLAIALATRAASADPKHPEPDPAQPHPEGSGLSDADLMTAATQMALDEETIEIRDDAPAESASSVHLDRDTLATRSRTQMSDILRSVPGLVVSQHAGGGKADQYFIRGFDADHGTDIAVFSDGVPVNLSSHGHGQGYADTHWMIPETIDAVDVHKGPYAARYGDYYTAGALELRTLDKVDGPTLWLSGGTPLAGPRAFDNYDRRLVGIASPIEGSLVAAQVGDSDGPFVHPSDFAQANVLGKYQHAIGEHGWLKLETTYYRAHWNASGQLPVSEVASGRLGRFDSIDPSEGGETSRGSFQASYQQRDEAGGTWHAMGYVVKSSLNLYSDFTLFAKDPTNGDEIEQTDGRWLYGLDAGYERQVHAGGVDALVTGGVQVRADDVVTSLWHDAQRKRLSLTNDYDDHIRDVAAYVEANVIPSHWLHIFPGVRIDRLSWDVTNLAPTPRSEVAVPGPPEGDASKTIASPKLSFEVHESEQVNLFANFGGGFHSNDARAAVASGGGGGIARAWGAEIGVRVKPAPRARVSMDVWYLGLSSEQVWNGDEGTTEPSGPTRRFGLDMDGSVDATPWLSLDGNITFSHSSFVENASNHNALALAPRWMGSGGATVHGDAGFVSVRARGIGSRPGNEDGTLTAQGYLIVDVIAGRQLGKLGLNLTINNALNADWREAQFAETSAVSPGAPAVEQMHFTPGIPLSAMGTVSYAF